jgi:uncharacterized membrane protein
MVKIKCLYIRQNGKWIKDGWWVYLDNNRRVRLYLEGGLRQERFIEGYGWQTETQEEWNEIDDGSITIGLLDRYGSYPGLNQ